MIMIATTYLIEVMNMKGIALGLLYLVVLAGAIPGSVFARYFMTKKKDPLYCIKVCIIMFTSVNFVAFLTLTGSGPSSFLVWVYSILWGFMLGWFFPTEVNIYSSMLPKGQEAEFAGLYLYCMQILAWFPPIVFTIINERGINLSWGGVQLNIYLILALVAYYMMPSWNECIRITRSDNKIIGAESTA